MGLAIPHQLLKSNIVTSDSYPICQFLYVLLDPYRKRSNHFGQSGMLQTINLNNPFHHTDVYDTTGVFYNKVFD